MIRKARYDDFMLPGKINFSPQAEVEANGTYSEPPWSANNVVKSGEPQDYPLGDRYIGWTSPGGTTVDPEEPYLQLDFPYD